MFREVVESDSRKRMVETPSKQRWAIKPWVGMFSSSRASAIKHLAKRVVYRREYIKIQVSNQPPQVHQNTNITPTDRLECHKIQASNQLADRQPDRPECFKIKAGYESRF